jgi:hypothetical protein
MALNILRGAYNVPDSNPAGVKTREEVHTRSVLIPEDSNTLSNESKSAPSPNRYIPEPKGESNYRSASLNNSK